MDKHIAALLKGSNRVIIPGFGALIAREGGEKLTFNELLKFDDGLLNDHVSKAENTDKKTTTVNIKKYVDKISGELKKGKNVKISTIGELYVDEKGKIQFSQSGSPKDVKAPPPPPPEEEKPEPKAKEEPKKPVIPPPVATTPPKEEKPEAKKEEAKPEPKKEAAKPEPEKEPAPAAKPTSSKQIEYKKTAAVDRPEPVKGGKTPPPPTDREPAKPKGESKKKGWVVWVIILVILIGGGTASWFIFTDEIRGFIQAKLSKNTPEPPVVVVDTAEVVVDTVAEADTIVEEEEIVEDKEIIPIDPYAKTGQYYVVAGCFRYERNADNYVSHLQNKGYNSKKFGRRKGLYVVCFEIYSSKNEAIRKMREIRGAIEPEAWVLKY